MDDYFQLFVFVSGYRELIIAKDKAESAKEDLKNYLTTHPDLPPFQEWTLGRILGRVDDNIFVLQNTWRHTWGRDGKHAA